VRTPAFRPGYPLPYAAAVCGGRHPLRMPAHPHRRRQDADRRSRDSPRQRRIVGCGIFAHRVAGADRRHPRTDAACVEDHGQPAARFVERKARPVRSAHSGRSAESATRHARQRQRHHRSHNAVVQAGGHRALGGVQAERPVDGEFQQHAGRRSQRPLLGGYAESAPPVRHRGRGAQSRHATRVRYAGTAGALRRAGADRHPGSQLSALQRTVLGVGGNAASRGHDQVAGGTGGSRRVAGGVARGDQLSGRLADRRQCRASRDR